LAPPGSLTWSWPKPAGGGPGAPAGSPALGPEAP
jgi:hypothetical protein